MLLAGRAAHLPGLTSWAGSEALLWVQGPHSAAAACVALEQTAMLSRPAVSQLAGGCCVSTGTLAVLARGTGGLGQVGDDKTACYPADCPVIQLFQK